MGPKEIVAIVNPKAANGAVGKRWPGIGARMENRLGPFQWHLTGGPGHASELARAAARRGSRVVVCVGGDGTLNEVINGLMEEGQERQPLVSLGYIPLGTGCDLARHLSIPVGLEENLNHIAKGHGRWMDLGKATFRDLAGNPRVRYFHNMVSFGLGGEVVERVNRTSKRFGGFLSFIWATLIAVFLYHPKKVFLQIDDGPEQGMIVWNVAVANGPYHGGGMWEAPGADVSDGKFQVTIIGSLRLAQVLYHFPKLYTGKIYHAPKTEKRIAARVAASSRHRVLLDMDGEQPGRLPACFEIIPAAVRIICPHSPVS